MILVAERILAFKERQFWILLAAMLFSLEILAYDFAGWGTANPAARESAIFALGSDASVPLEWLDYYVPRRAELGPDLVRSFGPDTVE